MCPPTSTEMSVAKPWIVSSPDPEKSSHVASGVPGLRFSHATALRPAQGSVAATLVDVPQTATMLTVARTMAVRRRRDPIEPSTMPSHPRQPHGGVLRSGGPPRGRPPSRFPGTIDPPVDPHGLHLEHAVRAPRGRGVPTAHTRKRDGESFELSRKLVGATLPKGDKSGCVETLLSGSQPEVDDGLDGVGCVAEQERQLLALGLAEVTQDEVGGVLATRRAADAEADSEVVLRAHRLADRAQTVVASLAAAALEPDSAGVDVELVVEHDEPLDGHVVVVEQPGDGAAGGVHVRRGHGEHELRAPDAQPHLGDAGAGLVGLEGGAAARDVAGSELLDGHGADVVAVTGVLRTGVAESDDEPGVHDLPWGRRAPAPLPRGCRAGAVVRRCGRLRPRRPRRAWPRTRPRQPRRPRPRRAPRAPRARCRPRPRPRRARPRGPRPRRPA